MRRKNDITDDALRFQPLKIIKNADFTEFVIVLVIVHTMQETKIDVIRPEGFKPPEKRLLYGIKIAAPAIFTVLIIDHTEVHLQKYLVPAITDGSADGSV